MRLLAFAAFTLPSLALACVMPLSETTLVAQSPADGAIDVAVDAGVVFDVRFSVGTLLEPEHPTGYIESVSVRAGEDVISGQLSLAHAVGLIEQTRYDDAQALQVVWFPDAPLAADTEYTVEFTLVAPDCQIDCAPDVRTTTFTTGDATLPPLTFEAAPSLSAGHRQTCVRETAEDDCETFRCQAYETDSTIDTLNLHVDFAALPVGAVTRVAVGPTPDTMIVESPTLLSERRTVVVGRAQLGGDQVCVEATVIDALGREASQAYNCFEIAATDPLPQPPPPADDEDDGASDDCSASGDGSGNPALAGPLLLAVALRRQRR